MCNICLKCQHLKFFSISTCWINLDCDLTSKCCLFHYKVQLIFWEPILCRCNFIWGLSIDFLIACLTNVIDVSLACMIYLINKESLPNFTLLWWYQLLGNHKCVKQRIGPITQPWGTPMLLSRVSSLSPFITVSF